MPLEVSITSNSKLLLKEFYIKTTICICTAKITLHNNQNGKLLNLGTVRSGGIKDVNVVVPFPVLIDQDVKYTMKIDSDVKEWLFSRYENNLEDCVKFESGIEIHFDDVSKTIPRIIFQQL